MFEQFPKPPSPLPKNEVSLNAESYLSVFCNRVEVTQDQWNKDRYRFSMNFDGGVVTVGVVFEGTDKKDFVITNMTTLPTTGLGCGSLAVSALVQLAHSMSCHKIIATQVDEEAVSFWQKNEFIKDLDATDTNDYVYKE